MSSSQGRPTHNIPEIRVRAPLSQTNLSTQLEPEADWKVREENNIRARLLPAYNEVMWRFARMMEESPQQASAIEREKLKFIEDTDRSVARELQSAIEREREDRKLAMGHETDPGKTRAWMQEQAALFARYSNERQDVSQTDRESESVDEQTDEDITVRESDEESDVTPFHTDPVLQETNGTWEGPVDSATRRTNYRAGTPFQPSNQHFPNLRFNSSSMGLAPMPASTRSDFDLEWTRIVDQIEQSFDSLYTSAKSRIDSRIAGSSGISYDEFDHSINDHVQTMSKLRQLALDQYQTACDLMMQELRWTNRLREEKLEDHITKEGSGIRVRRNGRDQTEVPRETERGDMDSESSISTSPGDASGPSRTHNINVAQRHITESMDKGRRSFKSSL
jgi:hypothetical protein